jgi:Domain of unknown function (DUF1990)
MATPIDRDPIPNRRMRLLARWGLGSGIAVVRYLMHRVPMYRRNRRHITEPLLPDFSRVLPGDPDALQRPADGIGVLYHRRYTVAYTDGTMGASELIQTLLGNLNAASPVEFSHFEPLRPRNGAHVGVGDELVVRLPGPWDGPVRVIAADDASFRLATLRGHMEAGEIEFRARTNELGWTLFEIESWARSGDRMFHILYDRLPVARELQLHMWSQFCERVVRIARGIVMTNVEMHTCTLDVDDMLAA